MKAAVFAFAVLGGLGCSGASDAIGSARGADPTKGVDESGDAQAPPESEGGTTGEASASDAGSYCFAPGIVCDTAKGAEPGVACCDGSCSATTGLCSVPTDGGVVHQDAAPEAAPSEDAGPDPDASPPACGPLNCVGCCQGDTCVMATDETNAACGVNGQACIDCGDSSPYYLTCNALFGTGPNQSTVIGGWCCQRGTASCY